MIGRMILFGASGDLTSCVLMPAIAQLADARLLPPGFTVLGSANTGWSTDDFRPPSGRFGGSWQRCPLGRA
jgi:glucose-6-phosphate 1-dehydrogenase